jgi:hypothetical protein
LHRLLFAGGSWKPLVYPGLSGNRYKQLADKEAVEKAGMGALEMKKWKSTHFLRVSLPANTV